MTKFSIIVPVYNMEQYLNRCLDSVKNQTYKNFECIIVNDGSTDNSLNIIKEYLKDKRFVLIDKENGGLSDARNKGVEKARGDYIAFLDSDDYIDLNYFEIINNNIEDDLDILKIGVVKKKREKVLVKSKISFNKTFSSLIIKDLIKDPFFEPAWSYIIRKKYYSDNNYKFNKNCYHEDYGLIPLVVINANSIKAINDFIYIYDEREGSIMTNNDYVKVLKKYQDTIKQFSLLKNRISNKILISYLANTVLNKYYLLSKEDKKIYKKEIEKEKIISYLLNNNIKRFIKKIIVIIKFKLI